MREMGGSIRAQRVVMPQFSEASFVFCCVVTVRVMTTAVFVALFPKLINGIPKVPNHDGNPVAVYVFGLPGLGLGLGVLALKMGPMDRPSASEEVKPPPQCDSGWLLGFGSGRDNPWDWERFDCG